MGQCWTVMLRMSTRYRSSSSFIKYKCAASEILVHISEWSHWQNWNIIEIDLHFWVELNLLLLCHSSQPMFRITGKEWTFSIVWRKPNKFDCHFVCVLKSNNCSYCYLKGKNVWQSPVAANRCFQLIWHIISTFFLISLVRNKNMYIVEYIYRDTWWFAFSLSLKTCILSSCIRAVPFKWDQSRTAEKRQSFLFNLTILSDRIQRHCAHS